MRSIEKEVLNNISGSLKQKIAGDIYHYTNLKGFDGIVRSHSLWASNAYYLNDKSEIIHSFNLIKEVINRKYKEHPNELLELADSAWSGLYKPNIYIVSLSSEKDSLSQWRAYGEHGDSYAISFNKIYLSSCLSGVADVLDVIYDTDQQITVINSVIDNYISKLLMEQEKINLDNQCRELFNLLTLFMPLFKNNSFAEEKEVRLIIREDSIISNKYQIEYRINNDLLIPYVEINFIKLLKRIDEFPVSSIMIGPNRNSELASDSAIEFAKKYFSIEIPVFRTEIPYRV